MALDKHTPPIGCAGFDAPASSRERDHLNRWPFAQEIYAIATTGPAEWSVRIGIYGEWGTGKTSVLEFIEGMAKAGGHITVRFNPWAFSDSRALWHAFVIALDEELRKRVPTWKAHDWRRLKKPASWFANLVTPRREKLEALADDRRVTLPLLGIDLLKDFFAYNQKDLRQLLTNAEGFRILVLIDDLDRTSATVVPEILFALKEVMDIPGVAFICAFDPVIVGEVLKERHPGFGDGLRFLEKIIDYPRWLPVTTAEGLTNLALADAEEFCPYVPSEAIRDAVPYLPTNPRAVRQFIRMLSLLRFQIERHYPHELRWPSILAANVLKVRYPRLAHPLLNDDSFWEAIQMIDLVGSERAGDLNKTIADHVERVVSREHVELDTKDRSQIENAMKSLCSHISMFSGFDGKSLGYQMNVAESPHSVTWKEFDAFFAEWTKQATVTFADNWIGRHANKVGRRYEEVYIGTYDAALNRYVQTLRNAENAIDDMARSLEFEQAERVFALLECLVLGLGRLDEPAKRLDAPRFGELLDQLDSLVDRDGLIYESLREREAALARNVVQMWAPDVGPLIKILQPFYSPLRRDLGSPAMKRLHKQLCDDTLPRFARQTLEGFREDDFISRVRHNREGAYETSHVLLRVDGTLWKDARADALEFFRREVGSPAVRSNVLELFLWIEYIVTEEGDSDNRTAVQTLLKDTEIVSVLWNSLISTPLGPRPIVWLRDLPKRLENLGSPVHLPTWWNKTLELAKVAKRAPVAASDDASAEDTGYCTDHEI